MGQPTAGLFRRSLFVCISMSAVSFLICDPSAALQTFFQQLIAGYGFDAAAIKATGNPHAASEMALSLKPDFLVTDWFAKESVTGIALHRQLVALNPNCRFGLLASGAQTAQAQDARDAGAVFFLPKPFSADDARAELGRAVEQLGSSHPDFVKQVQARDKEATQLWAANLQIPALPKFKPGDRVVYRGQTEVVQHAILRRGEMVVQLRDVAGLIESSKIQPR
jgi:two-component system chemotaxis response regulator CheY